MAIITKYTLLRPDACGLFWDNGQLIAHYLSSCKELLYLAKATIPFSWYLTMSSNYH